MTEQKKLGITIWRWVHVVTRELFSERMILRKIWRMIRGYCFPGGLMVKSLPPKQDTWVRSLGREDPRGRKWQPTPVFLPEKSHGRRILVGYSSWRSRRVGHDWVTSLSCFFERGEKHVDIASGDNPPINNCQISSFFSFTLPRKAPSSKKSGLEYFICISLWWHVPCGHVISGEKK